jgi:DNA gyrase subunit A
MTQTRTKRRRWTIELAEELGYAYREYAHYTLLDRAIADVRDGLKPVQRRIIYAMGDMGLNPSSPHRKCARVVGEVLGKYHPHGDQSVYDALARMAQDFSQREVTVDGQGNFGSIDGDSPAAMRYTECRLAPLGAEMLRDIGMDTVDWQENFDNSLKEPVVLPTAFPNALVNGSSGIAVGFAANLPPHNLGEVCSAIVLLCKRWKTRQKITVQELMKVIPGPDFPTGGIVYRYRTDRRGTKMVRSDAIEAAYTEGSAGIVCQARMRVEPGNGRSGDQIVITEIPFGQRKSTIIQRIAKEARESKINGVTDIADESDREGLRIVVQLSRQALAEDVLDMLVRRSTLRATFGVNNLLLVPRDTDEGQVVEPRILGLREMIEQFVLHRLEIVQRRSRYELARRLARLHIVEGLLIALDRIDEVIETIRRSRRADTARRNLMRKYKLTERQATAILDMQLRRLAAMERSKIRQEKRDLEKRIKYLEALLASEAKQLGVIAEETTEIRKKYATRRRTTIVDAAPGEHGAAVTAADLAVPDAPQVVTVTFHNILRCKQSDYSYRVRPGASKRAVKAHRMSIAVEPTDKVLLVTSGGRAWLGPVGLVPQEETWSRMGLAREEHIVHLDVLGPERYLVLGSARGKVKRTPLSVLIDSMTDGAWEEVMGLAKSDRVIFAGTCSKEGQVLLFTNCRALRTTAAEISEQKTLSARGVTGIKISKGDAVIGGAVLEGEQRREAFILSEAGYLKRLPVRQFTLQGRGGKGMQSLRVTKSTGPVIAATAGKVSQSTKVDLLTRDSKRQRIPLKAIPRARTRQSRGKKLAHVEPVAEIVLL